MRRKKLQEGDLYGRRPRRKPLITDSRKPQVKLGQRTNEGPVNLSPDLYLKENLLGFPCRLNTLEPLSICHLSFVQMQVEPDHVVSVRLILRQPSSAWLTFSLEEIKIYPRMEPVSCGFSVLSLRKCFGTSD